MENVSEKDAVNIPPLDFNNTEIAFRRKSDEALNHSYQLFRLIANNVLAKIGPSLTSFALSLGLPVTKLIKQTIFKQFCGGESIEECELSIQDLAQGRVGTILDYSVEAAEDESAYSRTAAEIIKTIQRADNDDKIPITVFKLSGLARIDLLKKISQGAELTDAEQTEYFKVKGRVNNICKTAFDLEVPVMIDAEESWIQPAIDSLALETMRLYNLEKAIVYNTYQLYRKDKLASLKEHFLQSETHGFILGVKLVRGAYMEKEADRAQALNYTSPIHTSKEATDHDFNEALKFCVKRIKYLAFIAGTHNEESCRILVELMKQEGIPVNHLHVYFSQLLGMSDNLSFNLANAGYNVAKYVPYGPVKAVLPYLFRRAEENSAIAGQMSRELRLIVEERKRRKLS
ncbi:MAG: proline dehydrogenase family protein [Pyrinomonadaceae bacterium]|nr:proline dehydrogenase family protein [Sphingobacteriaceae bacterium]